MVSGQRYAPPRAQAGTAADAAAGESTIGALGALGAYTLWGVFPIYFKMVAHVPPGEILASRIVWSLVIMAVVILVRRRYHMVRAALTDRRQLLGLTVSAFLISLNWLTFIYAIQSDQALQASLGYYINPLISVMLGMVFLSERLRPRQGVAFAFAVFGVLYLTWQGGVFPWISLTLAISFGLYGLVRKSLMVGAQSGLLIETLVLSPLALIYLASLANSGAMQFLHVDRATDGLLLLSGVVTTLPILLFTFAAQRLRLSTLGFLQYINPTMQFVLAVFLFREPMSSAHLVAFGFIWTALALYSYDTLQTERRRRAARANARA